MTNDMKKPMKNRIYLQRFLWFWLFIFQACDMDIQSSDVKSSMPRASQIDTWNMKMDEVLKEAEERKLGNWSRFKWCVKETTCKNAICLSGSRVFFILVNLFSNLLADLDMMEHKSFPCYSTFCLVLFKQFIF